ncbi:uncharacterized protein LOC132312161 [Cornus florida]|uniref:uncharacterized protein LOC132312161 n=1 Tax=Cornus florida TaxID=4283 RepID=UPI0028A0BCCE|nr:uncharacterized protein LOC132312161 [Cornus florida]
MKVTGDNAGVFTAEHGIIVRGSGKLLIYESWLDVPEIEKQIMYNEIKQHFQVDFNDPHHKEVVDLQLHTRLKDYRHEVKSHWNLFDPDEAPRNPYKSVRSEVWSVLCNRFMSEKHKEISEENQRNWAALQVHHCGGSKSFVRYIEEKKTSQNGVQPSLVDVYEETHHHPEKGWTCEKARELHGSWLQQYRI